MKLILVVMVAICCVVQQSTASSGSISSWACMAANTVYYMFSSEGRCSIGQMQNAYNQMKIANCQNCDKYFHCMGNYNAVYNCQRSSTNRQVATDISNCREWGQSSSDSVADQAANSYGRNGGNCGSRYLCNYRCYYDPRSRICDRSVCN